MVAFQTYLIHHLMIHLLKSLFLSKTFELEVRDEMVREEETMRGRNCEKGIVRRRNSKRKKWCKYVVLSFTSFFNFSHLHEAYTCNRV